MIYLLSDNKIIGLFNRIIIFLSVYLKYLKILKEKYDLKLE
ncbi:MAG: hypothetical protein RIS64_1401 [Bacteroidota bacterium]